MEYRNYPLAVTVNGIRYEEVWIDSHYAVKHSDSIDDALILLLVKQLEGKAHKSEFERNDGFIFFASVLQLDLKPYKLIWLTPPDHSYLGVRTAFRRSQ